MSDWFKANRLSLNVKKTNFILFGNKSKKLGCKDINFEPTLKVNDEKLMRVTETKFLGVIVDQNLNWRSHIDFIALKISRSLAILSKLKHLLSNKILLTLYYTLIFPHLSYCIIVWGGAAQSVLHKLDILQKRAIRIVNGSQYLSHTSPIFKKYNVLRCVDLYTYNCGIFMFKCKNNALPSICSEYVVKKSNEISFYNFRTHEEFKTPLSRTTVRMKSFKCTGPTIWNSLSNDIIESSSLNSFKIALRRSFTDKYN